MLQKKLPKREVPTQSAYDGAYRHLLWQAIVEDSADLDMGFRAYHAHIRRSLTAWKESGTGFLNSFGKPLNLDALNADDLYGFLGKQSEKPIGPGRKIHAEKVAVIDAFVQKKFPGLVENYRSSQPGLLLSLALKRFFSPEVFERPIDALVHPDDVSDGFVGVFLNTPIVSLSSLKKTIQSGSNHTLIVSAVRVGLKPSSQYCIVHRVDFPLESRFLTCCTIQNDDHYDLCQLVERHRPQGTLIFGGIGILTSRPHFDRRLLCIMRDQTTYDPLVMNLQAGFMDRKAHDFWDDNEILVSFSDLPDVGREYRVCTRDPDYISMDKDESLSPAFYDHLAETFSRLGSEI